MAVKSTDVTRRSLGLMLAGAAAVRQAGAAAAAQTGQAADADLESARDLMRANLQQIAQVKLPMATEPACHFKAS